MDKIKILIADDHQVIREGLRTMLSAEESIEVVGEATDGAEAVDKVLELGPDLVLMDIRMPGMDGIEATRRIKRERPATDVIILTAYNDGAYLLEAVRAGVAGFLLKDASPALLLHAIRAISLGGTLIETPLLVQALTAPTTHSSVPTAKQSSRLSVLTPRESEVLGLVARGRTNKQIASQLFVTEDTAKKHVHNIAAKLGASGRTQAATIATRAGVVEATGGQSREPPD